MQIIALLLYYCSLYRILRIHRLIRRRHRRPRRVSHVFFFFSFFRSGVYNIVRTMQIIAPGHCYIIIIIIRTIYIYI